jgi:aspartate kinase
MDQLQIYKGSAHEYESERNMRVFKFGGASVKDANGIRNMTKIIQSTQPEPLFIVISAIGKTTNALEAILKEYYSKTGRAEVLIEELKHAHFTIARDLLPAENPVFNHLEDLFAELYWAIEEEQIKAFDYEYDQIVSIGEMLSTRIVAAFLMDQNIPVTWIDARDLIRTDDTFREGNVDWEITEDQIKSAISNQTGTQLFLTQGFIGGTSENFTTTLGREGSDYTAAILAHAIDATEVVIWKDVPGVLNANPAEFPEAVLIHELSFYDAIELSYYGATVIHPKTIKPLQNKNIPLFVKSFLNPEQPGTRIYGDLVKQPIPTYIFKKEQLLLSISPRDFSFIVEENIRDLFDEFTKLRVHVNLMQNSALNFSVCLSIDSNKIESLIDLLNRKFKVKYNQGCTLVTIRNYTDELISRFTQNKLILIEQRSRQNVQLVIK